jgi:hypothetical protein
MRRISLEFAHRYHRLAIGDVPWACVDRACDLDCQSPLATVPRKIGTAWFLGVVGSDEKARRVAFGTVLNAEVVPDVLRPPTCAHGVYGSWARKPA